LEIGGIVNSPFDCVLGQLAEAEGDWQPSSEEIQGSVFDAEYWLWDCQGYAPHATNWVPQSTRPQREGECVMWGIRESYIFLWLFSLLIFKIDGTHNISMESGKLCGWFSLCPKHSYITPGILVFPQSIHLPQKFSTWPEIVLFSSRVGMKKSLI
jgi:hypothetical protein